MDFRLRRIRAETQPAPFNNIHPVGRAVACLRQTCAVSPARRLCERQIMKFFPIAVFGTMMSFSAHLPVVSVAEDQRSNGMIDTHIVQQAAPNDVRNSTPAQ